jgi:hypothetical protein
MSFPWFRQRIRHPLFPHVAADPAAKARGCSPALAGTFDELAAAAARGAAAQRAVYVLTGDGEPLSEGQRDDLWRLFEVPVYALATRNDRVTAWECEAQNGLHFAGGGEEAECACGRGRVRLPAKSMAHAATAMLR